MSLDEKLDRVMEENKGYLLTRDAVSAGISKPSLASYVKENQLERVSHGVYVAKDAWLDDLYIIGLRNRKAYFSHETALHLHGLMEREPFETTMTVKAGYNATHLRKEDIRIFQVKEELFDLGLEEVVTFFGNKVQAYNKERTICDIVKNKNHMDVQIFQFAIKEYMQLKNKDLTKLMSYAEKLNVLEQIKIYIEML